MGRPDDVSLYSCWANVLLTSSFRALASFGKLGRYVRADKLPEGAVKAKIRFS